MYEKLVKRLRNRRICIQQSGSLEDFPLLREAADAIEQLSADLERSKEWEVFWEEEANEALKKFQTIVARMPCWIPVTERCPEDRHDVLVYAGVLFPYIAVGYYDGLWKFSFNDEEIAGSADYWMPLPEPPKEECAWEFISTWRCRKAVRVVILHVGFISISVLTDFFQRYAEQNRADRIVP